MFDVAPADIVTAAWAAEFSAIAPVRRLPTSPPQFTSPDIVLPHSIQRIAPEENILPF
jgi:hypothetical protein